MCKISIITLSFLLLMLPIHLNSHSGKAAMISDIQTIQQSFAVEYAPADWKYEFSGWKLQTAIDDVVKTIQAKTPITIKDYQVLVKQFFRSTQDYHVSPFFFSTESASLPFDIKGAGNRFFIIGIDADKLSTENYPIDIGDELISIGGRTAADVMADLQYQEFGSIGEGTDRSLSEIYLTSRNGARGQMVPRGPVEIVTQSAKDGTLSTYELQWDYIPEQITSNWGGNFSAQESLSDKLLNKKLLAPLAKEKDLRSGFYDLASWESYIPTLGEKIWSSETWSSFNAYIYLNKNGDPIGYIRIATYDGDAFDASQFATIIKHLQANTSALVIDQINNPGGSVFYMYALASMLSDRPLVTPRHHYKITQADVAEAIESIPLLESIDSDEEAISMLGDSLGGYPVTYQLVECVLSYYRFMLEQWKKGNTFTEPNYLMGLDSINVNRKVHYTKPILLVVNELDFSGADFLPAILQDNNRVTILGTKTAGAGGLVIKNRYPSLFGVQGYTYTASIAERVNGKPIENLGVTPDIIYNLTSEDIQFGFEGYAEAINKAATNLLEK